MIHHSEGLSWNDNEEVVRAAIHGAFFRKSTYVKGDFGVVFGKVRGRLVKLSGRHFYRVDEAWKKAREHKTVQSFEQKFNPTFGKECLPVTPCNEPSDFDPKWTPGDWEVCFNGTQVRGIRTNANRKDIPGAIGEDLFRKAAFMLPSSAETKANAYLMASSKKLYETLDEVLRDVHCDGRVNVTRIRAVMAEARGEV